MIIAGFIVALAAIIGLAAWVAVGLFNADTLLDGTDFDAEDLDSDLWWLTDKDWK